MRGSNLAGWPAYLICICVFFASLGKSESSINVALEASFAAAPYLVELLETAAIENETSYFPLLDRIAEGGLTDLTTEKEVYERFLEILQEDGHLRNPESFSSFKFALALHEAAPRIQAHFQYYNTSVQSRLMIAQDAACPIWVHFNGQQHCSPSLERAQQAISIDNADIPFDRILSTETDASLAILYADITHPQFPQFHSTLSEKARDGKISYRIRYRPSNTVEEKPLFVSGYGVELVLKRTDYIVIDDRDESTTGGSGQITLDQANEDQDIELKPLTTSELADLGINAASFITSSENTLDTLMQVTSNFPRYSSLLASRNATPDFITEHKENRMKFLRSGYNILWINGLQVDRRQVNAYSLLEHLRRERRIIDQMKRTGLTASEAIDLLSHEVLTEAQTDDMPQRFDWRDEQEESNVIMWLNDIEKDKRYASWPSDLRGLFQRTYPGQLPQVARDIHNLIVPMDLSNIEDLSTVTTALQNLVKRLVPIRIGLVPCTSNENADVYAKLSYHILDTYGLSTLIKFYEAVVTLRKLPTNPEKIFAASIANQTLREGREESSYSQVLEDGSLGNRILSANKYLKRLDLEGVSPLFVLNGVVLPRSETWFEKMSSRVYYDLQMVQQGVYEGAILEDAWVPDFFLFQASARRNSLVIPHDKKSVTIADVASLTAQHSEIFASIPKIQGGDSALLSDRVHLLIIADLDSEGGHTLLSQARIFQQSKPEVELSILHSGTVDQDDGAACRLYEMVLNTAATFSNEQLASVVDEDLKELLQMPKKSIEDCRGFWSDKQQLRSSLGLESQGSAIWLNGRLLLLESQSFSSDDFDVLLEYERTERIAPVTTAITGLNLEDRFASALDLAKITSLVARSLVPDLPEGLRDSAPLARIDRFKVWEGKHTSIHLPADGEATIKVTAVVDPASELTQDWVPLFATLSELEGVEVTIYLNPEEKLTELPIKRFYRQIVSSAPTFDSEGSLVDPKASFIGMPKDTLFNLGMSVPPSWLVAPKESVHDLDNIKLGGSSTEQDIEAIYELEHILIEGHARDASAAAPPRGVQLLLGTEQEPHFTDTIVMANLGYFQFKANPGFWDISLKPGRSSKIFTLDSVGPNGYYAQPGDETSAVALLSFRGVTLFPRLSRKAGMEQADVLETPPSAGSAMDYFNKGASFLSSSLGLKKAASSSSSSSTNAEINIFSVASGHLYERMLNIMMVSVLRHTKHSVKFWFIEQFLSPSFKSTLPLLASHYNFSYEMVTYKWPHWLRSQKEKQREIWGYKILFLDVLFPLGLDKVIFVDADQIVRTDLMDLNRVDLRGAPYGFTPMCDSRLEMEGFRFWKQGYWETFLRGKPYHISALYVVDLIKFRQLAAGDRLRQQYQALSADPASLSNLDQDLPNHMQHSLPIHSLDADWLWCETWCSDESLGAARTIDLCNNPLTKEPKLDRARRQVPEWNVYDEEIAAVIKGQAAERDQIGIQTPVKDEL